MGSAVIKTIQIGFGYWGPNLARNVEAHETFELCGIVDLAPANRNKATAAYPNIPVLENSDRIFSDDSIDAIVVSTPAGTHFSLCKTALEAGKHCLVTKPVTTTSADAQILANLATAKGLCFLVDHTFLYSPAVRAIKSAIRHGDIGKSLYFESIRTGLGIFKDDANVVEDLAIHDLAIIDFLFDEPPEAVCCQAFSNFSDFEPNLSYLTLSYASGFVAHVNSHWLSPIRQRQVIVAGDKKMLHWDDTKTQDKVMLADCGLEFENVAPIPGRAPVNYRNNGSTALSLDNKEPLAAELDDFYQAITKKEKPVADVHSAVRVMKTLEAAQHSIRAKGLVTPVNLK
ncbi:Gfo/Idh/MocA family oxidoreductase [Luminiphilus sp.]|nr:Gfo/Idh/MocA family oxidoreductase [Luminiphilus sp.]